MPNGIQLSSGVVVGSPIPLDAKYGPYASTALALSDIPEPLRHKGLTVGVLVNNAVVEYWFRDGVLDTDFIEKQSQTISAQLPTPILRVKSFDGAAVPFPQVEMLNMATGEPLSTTLFLRSAPEIVAQDIPLDVLNTYSVYIECVIFTKNKRNVLKSFVVPSPWTGELNAGVWTQTWDKPWPITGYSRTGNHNLVVQTTPTSSITIPIKMNRPNHFPVTANSQVISLAPFLNGRFTLEEVKYNYLNPSVQVPAENLIELPVPVGTRRRKTLSSRYPYSSRFTPFRIAARYMFWKPGTTPPAGTFVVGPLSRVAKIWMHPFPFNTDHFASSIHAQPVAKLNPAFETGGMMQTWIE